MLPRFCPKCGAALEFSAQKFCTSCGATLPEIPAVSPPLSPQAGPAGIPVWIFAAAGIALVFIAGLILLPHVGQITGSVSSAPGGSAGKEIPVQPTLSGTPLPTSLPISPASTSVPVGEPKTGIPPLTPTQTTISTTSILSPTATTTVPTPTPTPEPEMTSVIKLAVTQAPPQPPASSYTSSTPGAPYTDPFALEMRIHELINIQREQNGLAPLTYDPFLADIARGHSWDMVQRNFFEHMNPDGKLARDRGNDAGYPCIIVVKGGSYNGISENILEGYRASGTITDSSGNVTYQWKSLEDIAQTGVNGWMASPGHRENILNSRYQFEGIGVAFTDDDMLYVTENFC